MWRFSRKLLAKGRYLLPGGHSDALLDALRSDTEAWRTAIGGPHGLRVLIATSMACYNHASTLERTLAVALTLRGAKVDMLLCDRALPACQMTKIDNAAPQVLLARPDTPRCDRCQQDAKNDFDRLGLEIRHFGSYLNETDKTDLGRIAEQVPFEKIRHFARDGMHIGEHAYAGALRYFAVGTLDGEPHAEGILRRFFLSSLLTAKATSALLRERHYDVAVFHHGIYTPQGIVGESCRAEGVRVVNWNPSYRKNTFIFSHGDTYHRTMLEEPQEAWKDIHWTDEIERFTMDYLASRAEGSRDWIWFHEAPNSDVSQIAKQIGLRPGVPTIGLLTNVMWDAQLHYRSNAFTDMMAWIRHTIEHFARRPELQLVIRVHPAEIRGMVPSRQRVADEIARCYPQLPHNVYVIPPDDSASTYALMQHCDAVLIYNTKTGIELSCMGIPVVVAGEAWIRGKGFSFDASNPEEYEAILERLPLGARLSEALQDVAKRYAFHFFFRRMIELPFIGSPSKYVFKVDLQALSDLKPGRHRGLDVICEGILRGAPFVDRYEERFGS